MLTFDSYKSISLLITLAGLTLITSCDINESDMYNMDSKQVDKPRDAHLYFRAINSFSHGRFDESAAEITDYHPASKHAFIVNNTKVDVLDYVIPSSPKLKTSLDISDLGSSVNSVAVYANLVAVAIQAKTKTDNGYLAIYNANTLKRKKIISVGSVPDMVTFTPNGRFILVANEGEPDDYRIDPEGSISIIDIKNLNNPIVNTARFTSFNTQKKSLIDSGVRIFGKLQDGSNSTVSQDLEPEYIAISSDSKTAYVTLQENNSLAIIDIPSSTVMKIKSFGYKDHSIKGNEIDPSNEDKKINISTFPLKGMYQPDSIAIYEVNGKSYIVTANEGESREWGDFSDETTVHKLNLDSKKFPNSACDGIDCRSKKALGKLKVTNTMGDLDNDGDYDVLYTYGTRSFSIWNPQDLSKPIYDSGSQFAKLIAQLYPNNFNANNNSNKIENRSDNKGIEPEGLTIGKVGSRTVAFIGLERISSIVAYDITNPIHVHFLGEINTRTFDDKLLKQVIKGTKKSNADGDLGPEGLHFISADDSPTGKPSLLVGYEVSGTSRLYEIELELKK